jgi:ribonuclease-3
VLERGLDAVTPSILAAFEGQIEQAVHAPADFKTQLQEEAAKLDWKVVYAVVSTDGPPHNRRFTCEVLVDGRRLGVGSGRSKKDAQQAAAAEALAALPKSS